MTNISAFKVYEGEDKPGQYAVMVADSMASNPNRGYKNDSAQKLFSLNGALLTAAGARNPAIEIYQELKKNNTLGPSAIATSILDISTRNKIPAQVPLDFIVSGYEDGKAKIFYINATGYDPYAPDKSDSSNKYAHEDFYAFSGSGSPFARKIVEGQVDLGIDPRPKDLTSGLSLMRIIAQAATESQGVNDKLQYGVITPNGMHVLFHPTMQALNFEEHSHYIKGLMNLELTKYGDFGTEEGINAREKNRPIWLLGRDFYNAFDLKLSALGYSSRDYRVVCDRFKDNKVGVEMVEVQKQKYLKSKELADGAVNAFLSGSADKIREYIASERSAREESYMHLTRK